MERLNIQFLQEVSSHAHKNKKTCHVTFFDLKSAFGSISHGRFKTVLSRYQIPVNVIDYVNSHYSNISGSVMGPTWRLERFRFKVLF